MIEKNTRLTFKQKVKIFFLKLFGIDEICKYMFYICFWSDTYDCRKCKNSIFNKNK